MKTVYFLGAGASAGSDFKLPVIQGFFNDEEFRSDQYPALWSYINRTFKGIPLEKVNLEEVITQLELSVEGFGALWERPNPELIQAREEFDQYIREQLKHSSSEELKDCTCHKRIFRTILNSNDDSIITLNYDLVADYTLYHFCKDNRGEIKHDSILGRSDMVLGKTTLMHGERPSLYHKDKDKGFYLKLHGSIDWVYCPTPTCGNHQLFFANWIDRIETHTSPGEPCILCGAGLVSVIIPPAMGKSFEKFPKMGLIWNIAYRELKEADRWVLIGISLPESDYHLRWLLRQAWWFYREFPKPLTDRMDTTIPELVIVNPNKNDRERILGVLGITGVDTSSIDIKEAVSHEGVKMCEIMLYDNFEEYVYLHH